MKYIALIFNNKTSLTIMEQGVYSLFNFVNGLLLARSCSAEIYGVYVLAFYFLSSFQILQSNLLHTPLSVLLPQKMEYEKWKYLSNTLFVQLVMSLFLSTLLFFGSKIVGSSAVSEYTLIFFLTSIVLVSIRDLQRSSFIAMLLIKENAIISLISTALPMAALLIVFAFERLTITVSWALISCSAAVSTIFFANNLYGKFHFYKTDLSLYISEVWRVGKWLLAGTIVFLVAAQSYPWCLNLFKGSSETARFSVCMMPLMLVNPLSQGLMRILTPQSSYAKIKGISYLKELIYKRIFQIFPVILLFGLFVTCNSEKIINVMYGDRYSGLGSLMSLLVAQHCITILGLPLDAGLIALNRSDIKFKTEMIYSSSTLLISIPLMWFYGAWGAGVGMSISKVFQRGFGLLYFDKYCRFVK